MEAAKGGVFFGVSPGTAVADLNSGGVRRNGSRMLGDV